MADTSDRCRVVLAALEIPGALGPALQDLAAIPIKPLELCLMGSADALASVGTTLARSGANPFLPLARNIEPLALPSSDLPLLATSDRLLTRLKGTTSAVERDRLDERCWLTYPLRTGLIDRLARGDVMLMAGPLSAEHMKLGTRVLLKHSHFPVQSHEFPAAGLK